ncbi:MAG: tripartite tricarboxylate transporter permease, partial [Deltaproteobacteria bacterium]|nr:tripartite tricarboxylate transporter permease [Deltaproteobacteria bacterium]
MLEATIALFTPVQIGLIVLGTFLGIVVGGIPGLTGSMLIALTVPITFYMTPVHATTLLVSMYVGGITGGLVAATLLRMPGAPAAVMTPFDGYPMSQQGRPGRALGLGITASFIGGLFAWVILATSAKPISLLAMRLSPFNYFALVVMALVLIATLGRSDIIKGLISGLFGILIALPGVDPSVGQMRLTFGYGDLAGGFKLLPVLIGIFAVSQLFKDTLEIRQVVTRIEYGKSSLFISLKDLKDQAVNLFRSSSIGTGIGILPGVGAAVASVISYSVAKSSSKTPEKFGHGADEGIVASEAANNASVGGALIPLVALGIPGSVADAILIGALMIHTIQPGPMLFVTNPDIVWNVIMVDLVATFVMFFLMVGLVRLYVRIIDIPKAYLLPLIVVCCVVGTFAVNNTMFDVWTMLGFGLIGFLLERGGFDLGPFVIGYILAPIAESELRQGLMITDGDYTPLFTDPISIAFLLIALILLVCPFINDWRKRRRLQSLG